MPRSLRLAIALVGALIVVAAGGLGAGCALSDPADGSPGFDPSLPEVDAARDPSPATGSDVPDAGTSSSATEDAGKDSGAGFVKDADVDAPPPVPKPAQGEVLITEVMYNPFTPEPSSEWFEVLNTASAERSLSGLTIVDGGGRTHVIAAGVTLAPGAYAVLARSTAAVVAAKVPAQVVRYEYGTGLPDNAGVLLLNASNGSVTLKDGAIVVAQAPYGGWYSQSGGSSVQLKVLDFATSAQQASWCLSLNAWAAGSDKGTPGAASDCP